jgi:RNA ligase (TIGR02306 family)
VIVNPGATWPNTDGSPVDPKSIIGKKIVYFQIDSVMPIIFEKSGFWNYLQRTYMGKKIISAKIRGVISQGMVSDFASLAPLFPSIPFDALPIGHNLTNDIGVIKFYSQYDAEGPMYGGAFDKSQFKTRPSPASLRPFPDFLIKTDQERLQNNIKIIRGLDPGRLFTAGVKFDGQSVQWFSRSTKDLAGHVTTTAGVCSRNFQVLLELDMDADKRDKANDKFRDMNAKYGLLEALTAYCLAHDRNLSVQTEMYGMAINGNRHKKNDVDLAVFDVYDIDKRKFLPHDEVAAITHALGLTMVPIATHGGVPYKALPLFSLDVKDWVAMANEQRYIAKNDLLLAEGIVVKSCDGIAPYVSFKVISPEYLIKHNI